MWLVIRAAVGTALLDIAASFVKRVLVALGMSVITYTGFSAALDWLRDSAIASFMTLPAAVVGMLAVMKVGTCISLLFSAYAVRLVLIGISSGTVKRWVKT